MSDLKLNRSMPRPTSTQTPPAPMATGVTEVTEVTVVAASMAQAQPAATFTATPTPPTTVEAPASSTTPVTRQSGALRPHETRLGATQVNAMSPTMKPKHESFAAAFASVMGPQAINDLKATIGDQPIVLIAGDQCTGKGTAAEGVVGALGGSNTGTGTVLRALAKENGLTIEQMSALLSGKSADVKGADGSSRTVSLTDFPHLGSAEDVDVRLDYRAATAIASSSLQKADGDTIDITVFESRLAGHLGQFLEGLGRDNIVSVYLYAAPRVQAERYLKREVFDPAEQQASTPAQRAEVDHARGLAAAVLEKLDDTVPLEQCLRTLVDAKVPGLEALSAKVAGIAGRDVNDKSRLLSLYGVDYQDRSAFDVVVDTNGKTPDQVKQAILDAVAAKTKSPQR